MLKRFLMLAILTLSILIPLAAQAAVMPEIIAQLQSPDLEVREAALAQLDALAEEGLPYEEGLFALQAATQTFPPLRWEWRDTAASLVEATWRKPFKEYIPTIIACYNSYDVYAKSAVLGLLARISDREASVALMDLLRKQSTEQEMPYLNITGLSKNPRDFDIFFPAILDYIQVLEWEWQIYDFFLKSLETGYLTALQVSSKYDLLKERYVELQTTARSFESDGDLDWVWDDDYCEIRELTAYLLDIFGYLDIASFEGVLKGALTFKDPRQVYFAAVSLLRQNKKVDTKYLNYVAADMEVRMWLFKSLQELDKLHLFPDKYLSQQALAESVMVDWLVYPTELGCAPVEIKLMDIISVDLEGEYGLVDFYIFKFKAADPCFEDEWMAGVAGYFIRKDEPTVDDWGYTFSEFEPWNSKTAEEHLMTIIEFLHEAGSGQ